VEVVTVSNNAGREPQWFRQDPGLVQEWIRQNNLIYGALIAIGVYMVQPFLIAPSLDLTARICVVAFAVAIPLLAALVMVSRQEAFRRRAANPRVVTIAQVVGQSSGGRAIVRLRRPGRRLLAHLLGRRGGGRGHRAPGRRGALGRLHASGTGPGAGGHLRRPAPSGGLTFTLVSGSTVAGGGGQMRIGELARRSGTSARSIRYYEQRGLMAARRDPNGYRDYDEAHLRLVGEIRSLLVNGFDLEEIRPFVDCLHAGIQARRACPGGIDVYRRKLAELDSRIGELQSLRDRVARELRHLEAGAGPGKEATG
jgi:DNA-binding transcriptional MerR regulator